MLLTSVCQKEGRREGKGENMRKIITKIVVKSVLVHGNNYYLQVHFQQFWLKMCFVMVIFVICTCT